MLESFFSSPSAIWFAMGLLGVILELVTGGFWMLFIGISALLTGLAAKFGLLETVDLRLSFFAVVTLLSLFGLRRFVVRTPQDKGPSGAVRDPVDDTALVIADISSAPGQIEYQGAPWTALSEDGQTLPAGTRVRIVRQDGMRFFVTKD